MNPILIIFILVYLAIGFGIMLWIQHDNEFRESELGPPLAYGSVVLWPIAAVLWLLMRPHEQLEDLASRKTYHDFKRFMRERGRLDQDLLSRLEKATRPDKPMEIADAREQYRDYHLEELINSSKWMEALRTANDMLRFAREQQEFGRAAAYEQYIRELKEKRRQEMG